MDINIINSWDFNTPGDWYRAYFPTKKNQNPCYHLFLNHLIYGPAPGHGEGQGGTNTLTVEEIWIAWEEIRNWTQQIQCDIKEIQSDF